MQIRESIVASVCPSNWTEHESIDTTNTTAIPGCNTVPFAVQKKERCAGCDMAHSVVYHQAWVRWLLCNDIIPKAIPLSQCLLHNVSSGQNIPTPKDLLTLQELTGFDTHVTVPHTRGTSACGWYQLLLKTTPSHSLPRHPTIKPHSFSLFQP